MLDDLAALRLQLEWGVDEALGEAPLDRLTAGQVLAETRPLTRPPAPLPAPAVAAAPDLTRLADLAAVHAALDGFRAHPLRATASSTVPPGGNPASGLVLIGDAPGADDDRSGQAFSGKAGALLDRVFGAASLGREHAMLTFLVPWRPPGGRAPNEAEIALALPFLHRALALVRPRRIVVFGEAALRTLVDPAATLRASRGRWAAAAVPGLDTSVPVLPMLAPERWLQSPATRQTTWADLLALREALAQA